MQSTLPSLGGGHRRHSSDTTRSVVRSLAPNKRVGILNKPVTAREHMSRLQPTTQLQQMEPQPPPTVPPLQMMNLARAG